MPTPVPPPSRPSPASLLWLPLGILGGSALALARARGLVAQGLARPEADEALVEWRVAGGLSADLVAGLLLALLAAWLARAVLGRGAGAVRVLAAALIAAGLGWLACAGGPWTPRAYRLELVEGGASGPLLVAALGFALALVLALRAAVRADARARAPALEWPALAIAALVALALPAAYRRAFSRSVPTIAVREGVRELLFEEDAFEVHVRHPEAPPRVGIITPAMVLRSHSGDLPSLIMPPPCEVSFAVRPEDGDVLLRTAVGVDVTAAKLRLKRDRWVFGFEVLRNGETAFETTIESWRGQSASERFWRPVGGERGLPIAPGDVVRLRTWLAGPAGEDAAAQPPLTAGFGQLVLERRPERPRQRSSPAAPSVVLIVQDTHRADRLSSHGYPKPTTPHLDALAERGLRYENAYATASWTWPATASILTGLLPDAHGVTDDSACFLSGRIETLAEVLQGQGYLTAAFVCNPLISPLKNFDQGFARFDSSGRRFSKTDVILPEVLDWLDEQAGTRFFLYLHLVDPHAPHLPRAEDLMRLGAGPADDLPGGDAIQDWNRRLLAGEGHDASGQPRPERVVSPAEARLLDQAYDASIATGDHYVGRLLERLEHLGLEDETVVVFTSDHGEEWLDHGLVTHGQSVHRELMQVPLILAGPGLPRGVSCATPVSNRHLAPTLARLGGGELEAVEDALELSRPSAVPEAPVFFATTHGWWNGRHRQPIYGVRAGRWALHLAPQGADWGVPAERAPPGGQVRLYDVSADPGETRDLAGEEPQVAERLRQLVVERLQQLVAERPDVQLEAGAATLDMLRGLGYLEDGR